MAKIFTEAEGKRAMRQLGRMAEMAVGESEADTITMDEAIEVDVGLFEMLLNSIANLKYIDEVAPETQKAWLKVIDAKWYEGMKVLSEHQHKGSA